ncbi:PAS domain S-box protein [Flagellimonas sp. HMM57]|uniref:PAS domain-containing sensor histidine kinase n=1 Tax=unclassified Flagellimonas TaxID=2644544 RepID=UPI0013D31214|nr:MULTISPECIES: PAS domain-containing sensor histidine kinase [unclassified Flagellimonas]UII77111.1 PAS domain S-box protein [Flagellimonas sp. HMM57]
MKTEQKSSLRSSNTDSNELSILKRALVREKKARKTAESLLENKAKELYDATLHLKEANGRLETLLNDGGTGIDNAFVNIIDPYVVMDMMSNVINMNTSAKEFLGYDHTKEKICLQDLVHQDYLEYTAESFQTLLQVGILKNYTAKILTKSQEEKFVNINASLVYNKDGNPIAAQGVIRDITQEVEIRKLLENQKKQQDIIVENSSLGILLIVNERIIKANKSFIDLLGYSEVELKKMTINDISSLEDSSLYKDLMQKSLESDNKKFSIVRKFYKKSGETLYGKTSMSSVLDANGNIEYSVAMIEDITYEKISEEKVRASEERLMSLIKNLQTGVLLEDQNRKIVLANQKFCDLFDIPVPPHVLKGLNAEKAIHKYKKLFLEPDTAIRRINHVVDKKEVVTADEMELLDGRTFERDYIPLFNNGEYQGHLWSYSDVTLRKNYRKNLEVQKEKYGSIIANMNLGLVEVDSDGNILMVNHSFSDMVGYSSNDLIGKNVYEAIPILSEETEELKLHNKNHEEGISDSYEVAVKIANGEKRFWLVSGAPRYDDAGNIIGSIGIHLDITGQKNLELQKETLLTELEASNKGLQEYAHIVSHDLKSPLRSVSALATWLYDDYKESLDESGRYNLKMMQEKIEGMDKLISGILKYSTVNNDVLDHTEVDVNEVIQEIKEIIYIPENVTIKTKKKLPIIKADKTKIHQLFQNFLSNAVVNIDKKKGLVEVDCKEHSKSWEFSIKDNGVGIPKEYHEKIFQIFQSIGNNERSTGIGLSIVKKIIDRYNGKVWLESEIGEGTTFFFTLKKELNIKK